MHVCLYMQYLGDMALKYFVTWTKKKKRMVTCLAALYKSCSICEEVRGEHCLCFILEVVLY